MEYKFKKHYKGRGVFIMERTISIEERIRRAEEYIIEGKIEI